ncbi:phage tail length tape measure family protein [Halopseudomonas phragmitis]|uniref:Bacteriophage tail tape measure N-terminal domain-containing protein n=1 Tax=Halopseudomonas phragmitis TaxID=1931241 RepID=A0A1V0B700_9GAMM|nr:phage tail length tape measure family protein [Halopseudomonas phragmitis]AQZ95564.1 hypothetical protein BVH74_12750 [Halopseudomonas phragmitis]
MSKKLELAMRIRAEMDQAIGQLRQLEGEIDDVGKQSQRTASDLDRIGSALGKIAAAVAGGALYKAVISATIEQERVTAQLEQRLRSTEHAAGLTRDELLDMAGAMQQVTTYGDEAVIPAQSLLLTFTKIGREVFPRALEVVLDMSVAMGQDLKSSAIQLGKALNDPVQGIASLSRVGVQFTDSQKSMIQQMVETGRIADAQRIILAELETQMGGSARAARDTFGGSIAALKNAFGDLLEGDPNSPGLLAAREAIEELVTLLSDPSTKEAFGVIIGAVAQLTTVAAEATVAIGDLYQNISAMVQSAAGDLDPLKRLSVEIRAVDRALKGGLDTPFKYLFTSEEELQAIRAQLIAERDLILAARGGSQGGSAAITSGVASSELPQLVEVNKEYEKLLGNLRRQSELFGVTSEAARVRYAIEQGDLGELTDDQRRSLLVYAEQLDAMRSQQRAAEDQARTSQRLAAEQQGYVRQLERQSALIGLNTEQVRAYEIAEKGLTGTLRDRAEAAVALLAAEERRVQVAADAATLAGLEAQRLRAQGREAEALTIEIEQRYGELMTRLQERGDTAGLEIVNGLINIEQARARLNELQSVVDQVFSSTARQEQSVQAQLAAGLITEGEARRRIIELHQQQAAELMRILPMMEAVAEITGDPAALENVQRIRAELENMQYITNDLIRAFRDGLQGGIEEALMGLVRGTHDLRDALESLVLGIADSMARLAAEQLADMATQSVLNLFQQGAQAATAAAGQKAAAEVAAINTVTAAQQAADTARAASSVAAANTAAAGQAGAAASTASAWTPAAIAASIGSFGSAAAIGLAAVVAAMAFQAFAEGGHVRGAGTTTSDSIPAWLSDYEFVTRAAVVQQPGALPFLHDFNERGMAALDDWAGRVRHATGGLAGVPAPALPAPAMHTGQLTEGGGNQTMLKNNIDVFVGVPEQFIVEQTWGRAGKERFYAELSQNAATVRQILGF